MDDPTNPPVFRLALNVSHPDCDKAADAFWNYWRANGETHRHGYYESTWGAINQAIKLVGVVPHDYGLPPPVEAQAVPDQPVARLAEEARAWANKPHGYVRALFNDEPLNRTDAGTWMQIAAQYLNAMADTLTRPTPAAADLHQQIMNLPCVEPAEPWSLSDFGNAYKVGHRDARHAAAQLVAASPAAAAPSIHALMDAAGYASSQGFLPGTTNWASAMQHALSHPAAPLAGQDFRGSSAQSTSAPSATVPREHIASADCWCQPEVDHVDPATGNTVYVHRSTQ